MEKKTFEQLREQRLSANEKLGDIYMKAANRELTAEEQMSVTNLNREIEMCENGMRGLKLDADNAAINRENANNFYKDRLRTWEVMARMQMNSSRYTE